MVTWNHEVPCDTYHSRSHLKVNFVSVIPSDRQGWCPIRDCTFTDPIPDLISISLHMHRGHTTRAGNSEGGLWIQTDLGLCSSSASSEVSLL